MLQVAVILIATLIVALIVTLVVTEFDRGRGHSPVKMPHGAPLETDLGSRTTYLPS